MDIDALSTGIYNLFLNDADLLAALGGNTARRLYDTKVPQDPDYPYAVFQFISGSIDLTFGQIFEDTDWQFKMIHKSGNPLNKTTINDVFKKLGAAYDDGEAAMTVSGYSVIWVTRGISNFVPTEDDTQQYVINYEIRIQKAR